MTLSRRWRERAERLPAEARVAQDRAGLRASSRRARRRLARSGTSRFMAADGDRSGSTRGARRPTPRSRAARRRCPWERATGCRGAGRAVRRRRAGRPREPGARSTGRLSTGSPVPSLAGGASPSAAAAIQASKPANARAKSACAMAICRSASRYCAARNRASLIAQGAKLRAELSRVAGALEQHTRATLRRPSRCAGRPRSARGWRAARSASTRAPALPQTLDRGFQRGAPGGLHRFPMRGLVQPEPGRPRRFDSVLASPDDPAARRASAEGRRRSAPARPGCRAIRTAAGCRPG